LEFDNVANAARREALTKRVGDVLERAKALDIDELEDGRRIEWGDGIFCFVQRYLPKPEERGRFEAHRKYADVQMVFRGTERIFVARTDALEPESDFDAEKDIGFYRRPERAVELVLGPGDYAVLPPWDAHMPSIEAGGAPEPVAKIVWKVPMA
jgi:YhcH/YjgK/YiaL family protein